MFDSPTIFAAVEAVTHKTSAGIIRPAKLAAVLYLEYLFETALNSVARGTDEATVSIGNSDLIYAAASLIFTDVTIESSLHDLAVEYLTVLFRHQTFLPVIDIRTNLGQME